MKLLYLVATAVSTLSLAHAATLTPPVIAIEEYEKRQVLGLEDRSAAPQVEARDWANQPPAKPKTGVKARDWANQPPAKGKTQVKARDWANQPPAKGKTQVKARDWANQPPAKGKTGVKARH